MQDILRIAHFEVRYQCRQPYFYGLLLLMAAQGLAVGAADYQQLADAMLLTNAPVLLYLGLADTGPLVVAAVALLTGQTLLRDRDYRVTYLYVLPINERAYFSGQLLGSLSIGMLLGVSYGLGLLMLPFWANGPVGEWPIGAFLDGLVRITLPNLLVIVCLSYALTALFRHIAGAYVALLVLTLGNTLLQLGYSSVVELDWAHLLDPFGAISIRQAVEVMTTLDKNTGWPDTPELLYLNRLLWLGLSGWLISRADARLSFPYMMEQGVKFKIRRIANRSAEINRTIHNDAIQPIPIPKRSFTPATRWKTAFHLAMADARWLVRQPAVAVGLLLLGLGIVAYALGFGDAPFGQRLLPYTARMTFVRLPMHLYISLFLVVFTGELIHRNRMSGAWQLTDVTPQPGWVRIAGHVGAMVLLSGAITATLLVTGVGLQVLNGQTPIAWWLYVSDLLTDGLLRYVQLIVLAALVSVVVPNRLVGHGLVVIILAGLIYFDEKSGGLAWWLYGTLPASHLYSDITGYGRFAPLRPVTAFLWTSVAVFLLLMATRLAQRGVLVGPKALLRRWSGELSGVYMVGLLAMASVVAGGCIWLANTYNTKLIASQSAEIITPCTTSTQQIQVSPTQRVNVVYQFVHPQNLLAVQAAVAKTLRQGADWLGPFPHETLHITETPFSPTHPPRKPAFIALPERDGWMTNTARPDDAGQLALTVSTQVLNQWLSNGMSLESQQKSGFLTDGLSGYLALRVVRETWGDDWLKRQLARQEGLYRRGRGQRSGREPVVLAALGGSYVATAKAPQSLTCIGEVWGHDALCRQIGRFYQSHKNAPETSPETYIADLQAALPNTYKYTTASLSERPQFSFAISTIWTEVDRIGVRVVAQKTLDDGLGHTRETLPSDYIPIVLIDDAGRILHRELVLPVIAERDLNGKIWLPRPANAATVVIDPLGAWPEANRTNNRKQLVRQAG